MRQNESKYKDALLNTAKEFLGIHRGDLTSSENRCLHDACKALRMKAIYNEYGELDRIVADPLAPPEMPVAEPEDAAEYIRSLSEMPMFYLQEAYRQNPESFKRTLETMETIKREETNAGN